MNRYVPVRHYLSFAIVALILAIFSGWIGIRWSPAFVPCVLFFLSSILLAFMALRPAIEVHESHLSMGGETIPWPDIRRVDKTGWISPLIVRVTLFDDTRILLIYPGDLESCNSLLRHLWRMSTNALIDGVPYRQFWGELLTAGQRKNLPAPRYRVLRPEDEAEVERLYQRLKTVGNLDQKTTDDK